MVAANLHGMLQATTGGIHQRLNQLFVRSGTPESLCARREFVLAMVTLFNVCIAWLTAAE
jgi:hypothetical protein